MIYKFRVEVLTPLTISVREGFKGLIYKTLRDRIPGSTIKGAILTKAIREVDAREIVEYEVEDPQISVTPGYACPGSNYTLIDNLLPTHPLCYIWKGKDKVETLDIAEFINIFRKVRNVKEAYSTIIRRLGRLHIEYFKSRNILQSTCEIVFKPAIAAKSGSVWREVSVPTSAYLQVGMEKTSRRASPGLLYGYEYVKPGQNYTGFIAGKRVEKLISIFGEEFEIKLGRGLSRGFGLAAIKLSRVDYEEFIKNSILRMISTGYLRKGEPVILYSISPLVTKPLGEVVNSEVEGVIQLPTRWIARNVEEVNASLKLKVYGAISFGTRVYRGFSLRTVTPKIAVNSLVDGTLLVCEVMDVSGSEDELEKLLTYTLFYGLDYLSTQGYNHVLHVTLDPFLT